ncbi:hypothetical protein GCM10009526_02100 [Glutamicibacter creatinolyticus]
MCVKNSLCEPPFGVLGEPAADTLSSAGRRLPDLSLVSSPAPTFRLRYRRMWETFPHPFPPPQTARHGLIGANLPCLTQTDTSARECAGMRKAAGLETSVPSPRDL